MDVITAIVNTCALGGHGNAGSAGKPYDLRAAMMKQRILPALAENRLVGEIIVVGEYETSVLCSVTKNTSTRLLRTTPLEKLKLIEIPVVGLDCKGCSYAAYEMIFKLPGVERATASFKAGMVTALIDPKQTDQSKLEEALKKGGVEIPAPAK